MTFRIENDDLIIGSPFRLYSAMVMTTHTAENESGGQERTGPSVCLALSLPSDTFNYPCGYGSKDVYTPDEYSGRK